MVFESLFHYDPKTDPVYQIQKTGLNKAEAVIAHNILKQMGIESGKAVKTFMNIKEQPFHSPFLIKEMDKAVERIITAVQHNQKIIFHGDYDADGVTTTALFVKGMKHLGVNVDWYVPHRHKDGYGLHIRNMKRFEEEGYDLLITGDTGIKEMETISKMTMDVIVTDHHEPFVVSNKEDLSQYLTNSQIIEKDGLFMAIPKAIAVVNPKRIDCEYPNESLSGVAVMFKLLEALYLQLGVPTDYLYQQLDLVATGMVADLIEQVDRKNEDLEARKIIVEGLKMINNKQNVWSRLLSTLVTKQDVTITDLGFQFGPHLNAPGRMDSPNIAVEFLIEEDEKKAKKLLKELKKINKQRKEFQKQGTETANVILSNQDPSSFSHSVVVKLPSEFHSGIVGLIASQLVQQYVVPVIVMAEKEIDGKLYLTGSCRSIEGISVLEALMETEKEFGEYRYGGHEMAAGCTIEADRFEEFKEIFNRVCKRLSQSTKTKNKAIHVLLPQLTPPLMNFYVESGSRSLLTTRVSDIKVKKLTPDSCTLSVESIPSVIYNFNKEMYDKLSQLEEMDNVEITYTINKSGGIFKLVIESIKGI